MTEKLSYTIDEAAKATGICRSRLYIEIGTGRLRMVKCGRRSSILAEDLRNWLSVLPAFGSKNAALTERAGTMLVTSPGPLPPNSCLINERKRCSE
jgi:excisionase family DNA binding protein